MHVRKVLYNNNSFIAYPKHVVPACKWDHSTLGIIPVRPKCLNF